MRHLALILALMIPQMACAQDVTARRTLPAGTVIAAADIELAAGGDLAAAMGLVGLQTRTTIYSGRPVIAAQLRPPRLVARNQIVPLTFVAGALTIQADGRALAEGGAGDLVQVMNLASRRTVSAIVQPDGSLRISH